MAKELFIIFLIILTANVIAGKFASGGGRGMITKHYSISWDEVWHRMPMYLFISAGMTSLFVYPLRKDIREKEEKEKDSDK